MSHNNFKYHELLATVPDSLLQKHGYLIKAECNRNGPLNSEGTAIIFGDRIVFEGKETKLESVFNTYVVSKDKDHKWATTRVDSPEWRS